MRPAAIGMATRNIRTFAKRPPTHTRFLSLLFPFHTLPCRDPRVVNFNGGARLEQKTSKDVTASCAGDCARDLGMKKNSTLVIVLLHELANSHRKVGAAKQWAAAVRGEEFAPSRAIRTVATCHMCRRAGVKDAQD